eukprot:scaffold13726_cov82-Cyclotella_meneghiniana.AAC.1
MKLLSIAVTAAIAALQARETAATFTINAADSSTGQVGATGSSCVPISLRDVGSRFVPGHGVCMHQALPPSGSSPVYGLIDTYLSNNTDPTVIINRITDPTVDTEFGSIAGKTYYGYTVRQYGCVDLQGRADGYTGINVTDANTFPTPNVQEDTQGNVGTIAYSAQGNIVTNTTVSTLKNTFVADTGACDLVERLYNTLAAVYESPTLPALTVGDVRCFGSNGAPGSSVFIRVDNADGSTVVNIENDNPDESVNPWTEFKTKYQTWRSNNPCSFEKVGDGVCVDASDNTYSIVWELGTPITSAEACGNWCLQHPEPNFVGFTSPKSTTHGCICHFSGAL